MEAIKPQDLRIGNLISVDGETMEVAQINPDNTIRTWKEKEVGTTAGCFGLEKPFIQPLPLNEEWLLKFGFENGEKHLEGGDILFANNTIFISDSRDSNYAFSAKCEYVHQLQNLYHALTGEELTLKQTQ